MGTQVELPDISILDDKSEYQHIPAGELSPISALQLLRKEFPEVKEWLLWDMSAGDPSSSALCNFIDKGVQHEGHIGTWSWRRVKCSYPQLHFWHGGVRKKQLGHAWIGVIRVTGENGEDFLMFSYMRGGKTQGSPNTEYLVSITDLTVLRRFGDDVRKCVERMMKTRKELRVDVHGAPDFNLDLADGERIYLPSEILNDIKNQVFSFFENGNFYRQMKIPYRRGMLFCGPPGTGKTMLIRHLARECYKRYRIGVSYLAITDSTDCGDLHRFFYADCQTRKRILILEDLDSLTKETRVTRSYLLQQLDGLYPAHGYLLLGTTNHPEKIDPAIAHRPSRFDRTWRFQPPTKDLRLEWLTVNFSDLNKAILARVASTTRNWTFAYLKELRITAGILAIKAGAKTIGEAHLMESQSLLANQFKSGSKGLVEDENSHGCGFNSSEEELMRVLA